MSRAETRTITTLLVGDHFRPPAKLLLAHLPSGCELGLEPEDSNPYDEEAVRVMLDPRLIPDSQYPALEDETSGLPTMGFTLEQVMSTGPMQLGYIPKTGGKPLLTAQAGDPGLVGNHEVREALMHSDHKATLAFGPDGKARVLVTYSEE